MLIRSGKCGIFSRKNDSLLPFESATDESRKDSYKPRARKGRNDRRKHMYTQNCDGCSESARYKDTGER